MFKGCQTPSARQSFEAFEIATAEVALFLHVADQRFDSGAAPELAFDGAEDTTLLSRDEDPSRVGRIVAAVSFIDLSALDVAAGETLGTLDGIPQGVTVEGIAG